MVTKDLEFIDWPAKTQVLTSSRRTALKFHVKLRGISDLQVAQVVRVTSVKPRRAAEKGKKEEAAAYNASAAPLILQSDMDTAFGEVSLQFERTMAPGEYVASVEIAGAKREVSFDILEDTSLRIGPSPAVIDTSRASKNEVSVRFENRGNISLPIDVDGDYPLGREEQLAADISETGSVVTALMAALNRTPRVLADVGTVSLAMVDGAFTLKPGTARNARIAATWNLELDPARRYWAFVPVFGSELVLAIVTAVKPGKRAQASTAGAGRKRN